MIDAVTLGAMFDWTAAIRATAENLLAGDAVVFAVPLGSPELVSQVEQRFEVWGRNIIDGCYVFSVHQKDAPKVAQILGVTDGN